LAFSIYSQKSTIREVQNSGSSSSSSSSFELEAVGGQDYYFNVSSTLPSSLSSTPATKGENVTFDEVYYDSGKSNFASQLDMIFVLLTLSLSSICLHIVIILHVRSTAPSNDIIRKSFEGGQSIQGNTYTQRKKKMLAYWVYDRYRNENNVESFDSGSSPPFAQQNAVHILPPLHSASKEHHRLRLEPDLSISDDGDLSEDLISSDEDAFYDTEEQMRGNDNSLLLNGHDDDHLYFFPTEEELNNFESPRNTRRRRTREKQSFESESGSKISSIRGLVDIHACFSKQGYDGT
jgi:hypothetical protein